jgi:glycosyltransferase involved in cell wall biosynthesis
MGVDVKDVSWQLDPLDLSKYYPGEADFPLPDKPFEVITLSRATPIKRIPLAVEAVKLARKETGLDIRLTVLGKGSEIEKCLNIARELEEGKWFSAPGFLPKDKVPEKLRKAHLLISPYSTASLSNQVWEAMASGVPTLSVIQGEAQSFIKHKENALIVDENNDVTIVLEITKGIITLVNNADYWKKIRENALESASNSFASLKEQIENRLIFLKKNVSYVQK